MINLIPNEEKKKMIKEFELRFLTLALLMAGLSMVITSIIMIPSYFLSTQKYELITKKMEEQKEDLIPDASNSTLNSVKELNTEMGLIESKAAKKFVVSEKILNGILLKKLPFIKITHIYYESELSNSSSSTKKASVFGVAPNREALLSFRLELEKSGLFKKVDLPISNFVKGSNIKFYLSVVPIDTK